MGLSSVVCRHDEYQSSGDSISYFAAFEEDGCLHSVQRWRSGAPATIIIVGTREYCFYYKFVEYLSIKLLIVYCIDYVRCTSAPGVL